MSVYMSFLQKLMIPSHDISLSLSRFVLVYWCIDVLIEAWEWLAETKRRRAVSWRLDGVRRRHRLEYHHEEEE